MDHTSSYGMIYACSGDDIQGACSLAYKLIFRERVLQDPVCGISGKDDIRFQLTLGESGRYVGTTLATDIVIDPVSAETKIEKTRA